MGLLRAERRIGEMMRVQKETVGFNPGRRPTEKTGISENPVMEAPSSPPTLKDAGIDKNLAERARKLERVTDDEEFEKIVTIGRDEIE